MAKPPAKRSSPAEIARFLDHSKTLSTVVEKQPRLIFAIDATASRQPTWDTACQIQQEMFLATQNIASLGLQLCYYRGFNDFFASPWINDSAELSRQMSRVSCEGGHTQIARLLKHGLQEHRNTTLEGLVFIGDAIEESPDKLCNLAGQCGLHKLPLFIFQEGRNAQIENTFRSMAKLSGGAYARFDQRSASTLGGLLSAVAVYAAGGKKALLRADTTAAKALLQQLP